MDFSLITGFVLAVTALLCWAVGDFSIQRGTRQVGNWGTVFLIGLFGFVFIFPFVWREIPLLSQANLIYLSFLAVITLFAALFLFEGLKRGKLAIIEPIFGIELPFTVAFSIILGGEHLGWQVYGLIALVFVGLMLTVVTRLSDLRFHHTLLEKGAIYAGIGSIVMGLMNFMTGEASQATSALVTIWFVHSFLMVVSGLYLLVRGRWPQLWREIKQKPSTVFAFSFFDNAAWVSYAASMVFLPISIATVISESYIVLTVLLGVMVNREKIRSHQYVGVGLVIAGILWLGAHIS